MSSKRIALRILLSIVVATVGVTVGVDSRADTKVFHGSMCHRNGYTSPPAVELSYNISGVAPIGSNNRSVICPVVRDNELSSMDVTDWDITVNRNGSTAAWTVQLWSMTTDGASGYSSTITVPQGSGIQEVDGGSITSAYAGGVMFLLSTLPASCRLARYQITESD